MTRSTCTTCFANRQGQFYHLGEVMCWVCRWLVTPLPAWLSPTIYKVFGGWEESSLTYWMADSAAAWDKCEEHRAKLAKAVKALERIELSTDTREQGGIAMAALAELKEEDRE